MFLDDVQTARTAFNVYTTTVPSFWCNSQHCLPTTFLYTSSRGKGCSGCSQPPLFQLPQAACQQLSAPPPCISISPKVPVRASASTPKQCLKTGNINIIQIHTSKSKVDFKLFKFFPTKRYFKRKNKNI